MQITLIDTNHISELKDIDVNFDMIAIHLDGYSYYIYQSPVNRKRLALDVYKGKDAEWTEYNGILPVKRSWIDVLKDKLSDFKNVYVNVFIDGKRKLRELKANFNPEKKGQKYE